MTSGEVKKKSFDEVVRADRRRRLIETYFAVERLCDVIATSFARSHGERNSEYFFRDVESVVRQAVISADAVIAATEEEGGE
jgi:hypothetical protein